ncbi:hypothetical protein BGZ60DRAFT_419112 [Tricladium varicosporioides]|nr:hypothetical protein BGZ60DRAFT_419112 [Hymenoscyphus varicosporioides]
MYFLNIINAVTILASTVMAWPQTPGQAHRYLDLESRQNTQGPLPCDDFGNNQNCPGQPSLCCLEGSLCLLDTDRQGQSTFQCF